MMMEKLVIAFLLVIGQFTRAEACTSIIVSGRASADGRPFIFKNVDATEVDNALIVCEGEKYRYVAITNRKNDAAHPDRVSSGYNETGFSIMNTVANNLNGGRRDVANNTRVIRRALEICKTLKDFETLLDTLPKPLHIDSNYGVMDAEGGIAYYEVGNRKYVKYDANDPETAPDGYLIRSNFGVSGEKEFGVGYERYTAMEMYIGSVIIDGKIRYEDVIRGSTRFLTHGETKVDLNNYEPENGWKPVFVDFMNFIPRRQTVCAQLIHGVNKGESPMETVAWTMCGFPITTVCLPIWLVPDVQLPKIVSRKADNHSMICDAGLDLKKRLFPKNKARRKNDINIAQLINKAGTGILQRMKPMEDEVFKKAEPVMKAVRERGKVRHEVETFYQWVDQYVPERYKEVFGIDML